MILIKSSHKDTSTSQVGEWLLRYKKEFVILSETDLINSLSFFTNAEGESVVQLATISNKKIDFNNIDAFWFRRGKLKYENERKSSVPSEFSEALTNEWNSLNDILLFKLEHKPKIGNYFGRTPNKLQVIAIANELGLRTPATLITDKRDNVLETFGSQAIINKTISDVMLSVADEKVYTNKTVRINVEDLPSKFFPSLFQEYVDKKYEIRAFYLDGEFYSMAIFSQQDEQTQVDFRNYNYSKPNRNVPYKLNSVIEAKLIALMTRLELNTGSVDLMVSTQNEIIFLEVNPGGQFGMVSGPCNYFLERKIAHLLSATNAKKEKH